MNYLLSVVIPTKNRAYYCLHAIKQILSLRMNNVEICIQDNSDTDGLKRDIEGLEAANIKYNYHPGILSFVDNFSEAISLASGDYVCMIGDDDGILPNIISVVEYASSRNIDAVIPGLNAIYYWPSPNPILDKGENGCVVLIPTSNGFKKVNTKKSLRKLVENGGLNYLSFDLARVYHGLVRRNLFSMIKERTGCYFDGLTPDIYMATALSITCNNVVKIDYPVTISGICPTSGSTDSATGKHTGNLKDAPHFRGHNTYEWDRLIPAFYSVETIWSESLLKALRNFYDDGLIQLFDIELFDSYCLTKYPQFADLINEHAKRNNVVLKHSKKDVALSRSSLWTRLLRKINHRFKNTSRYYDIVNISDAANVVSAELGMQNTF